MTDNNITEQVFAFMRREIPSPLFSSLSPKIICLTTDLRTDLRMLEEDAESMLKKFFQEFSIKNIDFDLSRYFPPEGLWLLPSFKKKPTPIQLTIEMLIKAAEKKEWITENIERK